MAGTLLIVGVVTSSLALLCVSSFTRIGVSAFTAVVVLTLCAIPGIIWLFGLTEEVLQGAETELRRQMQNEEKC